MAQILMATTMPATSITAVGFAADAPESCLAG